LKETTNRKYRVIVADNFHYMDESKHYTLGEFNTLETAIAACRKIVDDDLDHSFKPGMTAKELYEFYTLFGEDPFVRATPDQPASTFRAWHYAKQRAFEICGIPPRRVPDAPSTLTRNEPGPRGTPEQTARSQEGRDFSLSPQPGRGKHGPAGRALKLRFKLIVRSIL
jgi:hypothetical protein